MTIREAIEQIERIAKENSYVAAQELELGQKLKKYGIF